MRLLIVQLSDIHVRPAENSVVARRAAIASAIRNLDPEIEACLILVTGDIANTGHDAEYSIAYDFLEALKRDIASDLGPTRPVYLAVIPGNHDCDLRGAQTARDLLRASLKNDFHDRIDSSVIDICTEVQRSFFDLRETVSDSASLNALSRLYYEYRFVIAGELVKVRCLNTAWLSQLHESEGTFVFPVSEISQRSADESLALTMLHHPFAWFNTPTRRALQRKLEEVSDVILSGHEHEHTRRTQIVGSGEVNQFIEGAALQTSDAGESSFNALIIDTREKKQRFWKYEWAGNIYQPVHRGEWQDFQVNQLRSRDDFAITERFEAFLDDPGAGFDRSGYGRPRLSELFVFPELRKISIRRKDASVPISGETALALQDVPHLLLSGAEQSGKTCYAKAAYREFRKQGLTPLYVDGAQFTPQRGERLNEQLYRIFQDQYHAESLEKYRQLQPAKRVIIVDSFHRVRLRAGMSERFLSDLEAFAGRVLLLTNDLAQAFGEILRAGEVIEARGNYGHYRIMPFGHVRRMELITRWLLLGNQLDEQELAKQLSEAEQKLEVILGKNFVPAFPIFLLSMLQGLDSASQLDTGASTYGYFYEILIKSTLARGSTQSEVNIRYNFLTALAFEMYRTGKPQFTSVEMRAFHTAFVDERDLTSDFERTLQDLVNRLVLFEFGDTYEFKYSYYYYYFVARHISGGLATGRADSATELTKLVEGMDEEEKANVLLFLAHLSPDPRIVEHMLVKAREQFADSEPAQLGEDVAFLNELSPAPARLEYEERPFQENRLALAEERDRAEREAEPEETEGENGDALEVEFEEVRKLVGRLMTGLRTMQILGQVLKNHPAAFDAELKERMASECYGIGFRALGFVLGIVKEGQHDIVRQMVVAIREERPKDSEEKVVRQANSVVFGLALLGSYGIIKRISSAVGSPDLTRTFERVTVALASNASTLTGMSIRLDQAQFPHGELVNLARSLERSAIGIATLQWLVLSHVNLFPTQFRQRQMVLDAVGIDYRATIGANPNQRLIGGGDRGQG